MNKEELEKEAEEKYSEVDREFIDCQDEGEVFNIGYILGAEPREKRIAELEEKIADSNKTWNELVEGWKEDCKELEKENAGLKARLNAINLFTPELEKASKLRKQQLTKAKEIIKDMLRDIPNRMWYTDNVIKRAEDFIKE